jgi:hypothetical protein
MPNLEIIRVWKDEEYQLNKQADLIEITDAELVALGSGDTEVPVTRNRVPIVISFPPNTNQIFLTNKVRA